VGEPRGSGLTAPHREGPEAEAGFAREPQARVARELEAAERAFQRGDWAGSARHARAAREGGDPAAQGVASAALGRFGVDLAWPILLALAVLFFVLTLLHYA
jgi:hypothetical protein